MVVEHGDVDIVELGNGFVDGARGSDLISVPTQDGCAKEKVVLEVVEEEDSNRLGFRD
jgi:hypothetical protein